MSLSLLLTLLSPVALTAGQDFTDAYTATEIAGRDTQREIRDGTGPEARFDDIRDLWGDGAFLWVADDQSVRRVELSTAEVTTLTRDAGGVGRNEFPNPYNGLVGIWGDGGHLYATDVGEHRLLRIDPASGEFEVIGADFSFPWGVFGRNGGVFVANSGRNELVEVDPGDGSVSVLAETGSGGAERFCIMSSCLGALPLGPKSVWGDASGFYLGGYDQEVLFVDSSGHVESFAETPWRVRDVAGCSGQLFVTDRDTAIGTVDLLDRSFETFVELNAEPFLAGVRALWCTADTLFVALPAEILSVDVTTGQASSLAGHSNAVSWADGIGAAARLDSPGDLWGTGSTLFFLDRNNWSLRSVNTETAEVVTLAGSPFESGISDGVGSAARFGPALGGLVGDAAALYIADGDRIRRFDRATRAVTTIATGFGEARGLWESGNGTLYVADRVRQAIFALDVSGPDAVELTGGLTRPTDVWGTDHALYIVDGGDILRFDWTTEAVTTVFESNQFSLGSIWGTDGRLIVTSPMMAIDLDTGEAHRLRYGSGPSTGDPLFSGQGIWSEGGDLFVSNGSLWRLEPVPGVSGREIQLPELGFDTGTSEETPDLSTGVVRIAPVAGPAPFAAATFSLTANGVLISETTVPTSPAATAGRLYAVVNETENTGVAFHNPSPQPVEVAFYFTDSAGVDFGHGTIDLEPGAQIARFVSEPPFDSGELEGTMTFESAVPVAALALHTRVNDRADFLMTHVPVGPVDPAVPAPEIVPNFVIGGGWESRLVLVNPTDSVVSGRFETPEFTGARIFAPPDFLHRIEGHPGIGFPYFIEPRSSSVVRLAGPAPEAESGFIRLVPVQGATPDAFAIATASEGDTVVHDATFVATPGAQRFRLYGRQEGSFSGAQAGSMDAGFAIANPGNETAEVRIDLLSSLGTHGARGTTLLVEPGRQFAAFLGDIPIPGPSLRIRLEPGGNLVRLSSDREIVVAGLRGRYNSREERLVSSVPAVGESLSPRADPTYLAHFANGAGYTTEWHVFPVSGVASATFDYLEPGGDPVFVPLAP